VSVELSSMIHFLLFGSFRVKSTSGGNQTAMLDSKIYSVSKILAFEFYLCLGEINF